MFHEPHFFAATATTLDTGCPSNTYLLPNTFSNASNAPDHQYFAIEEPRWRLFYSNHTSVFSILRLSCRRKSKLERLSFIWNSFSLIKKRNKATAHECQSGTSWLFKVGGGRSL